MTIIRNAIHCNTCDQTIESTHVHDFVSCRCDPYVRNEFSTWCAVDGGHHYLKRCFGAKADYTELST